jgi:ABC-type glycerol-3-phosphate transport system substrate-binding protein
MPEEIRENAYIEGLVYLDGAVYAAVNGEIYVLHENDEEFSLFAKREKSRYLTHLLSDGKKMYGFYMNESVLCALENDNGEIKSKEEFKLDMSNHMGTYGEGKDYIEYPQTMQLIDGKLCIMYMDSGSGQSAISVFDIKTGEEEICETVDNMRSMSAYKDGKLLVTTVDYSKGEGAILNSFDIKTKELEEIGPVLKGEDNGTFFGSVIYNPEGDYIFVIRGTDVLKRNDGGAAERISYLPADSSFLSFDSYAIMSKNRLAQQIGNEVHIISLDPKDLPKNTLNVLGDRFNRSHDQAIKKLQGTAVNVTAFYADVAKELSEKLVSGSGDVDIVLVQSRPTDIRNLINKGYALDMSDIPGVKEYYDALYPYYKEVNPDDGKIYAIPMWSQINNFSCDPELFKKLNIEIPETFDEFCDCLAWWYDNRDITEGYNLFELPKEKEAAWDVLFGAYNSYIIMSGQELKYDTPEFRAMAEKLSASIAAIQGFKESPKDWDSADFSDYYSRASLMGNDPVELKKIAYRNELKRENAWFEEKGESIEGDFAYEETYPYYPMMLKVKEDVPAGASANVEFLLISSKSKNVDTAKQYVKANIESQDAYTKAQFFENFDELIEKPYFRKNLELLEKNIAQLEESVKGSEGAVKTQQEEALKDIKNAYQEMLDGEGKYEYTLEDLNEFKSYLKNVYIETYFTSIMYNEKELYSLRSRLVDGQIDIETFIKEMDAKLELIKLENQ